MSADPQRKLILFGLRISSEPYHEAFETLGYEVNVDVSRPTRG